MHRDSIKTVSLALAFGLLGLPAACATPPPANPPTTTSTSAAPLQGQSVADLQVHFTDIKQPRGFIMIALFDSEAAYDGGGRPIASARIPVTGAALTAPFPGLPPGDYALRAFHDIDGDGKMGQNPFGVPTEPYAFSNNAPAMMGPAKWAAARFSAPAGASVHTVKID